MRYLIPAAPEDWLGRGGDRWSWALCRNASPQVPKWKDLSKDIFAWAEVDKRLRSWENSSSMLSELLLGISLPSGETGLSHSELSDASMAQWAGFTKSGPHVLEVYLGGTTGDHCSVIACRCVFVSCADNVRYNESSLTIRCHMLLSSMWLYSYP